MIDTEAAPKSRQIDFGNDEAVGHALGTAVRDALRKHKRLGQSIVIWQDGKVVWVAPEDIPVGLADEAAS